MLVELRVSRLGVIEDQAVLLGPGLTALTGETGAGKTLLVDAISLLTGGAADPALVAAGAAEARVEGRFVISRAAAARLESAADPTAEAAEDSEVEVVLSRVVPATGRSRAYINGRMVSGAVLAESGRRLIDIHGQNAHQTLLSPSAQRRALDAAAGVDPAVVSGARRRIREITKELEAVGGDPRERARQIDLLNYQLTEMDKAEIDNPDEDEGLVREEELLADASGLIEAAQGAWEGLTGDDGVVERLGPVTAITAGRRPLAILHDRLLALQEELSDVAAEARQLAESVESDPERLSVIGERRRVLTELRRKYGPSLADVIGYRERIRQDVEELASHEERAAALHAELDEAEKALDKALRQVWQQRRDAAPELARAVEGRLQELAMPRARFEIEIGEDPAEESVTWLLSANPGQPLQPLAKVASGGELARAMLASRLVMGPGAAGGQDRTQPVDGPGTLVFDEVDAGIGGEAAQAVGRALAALAETHQVLVVTHLAQVAAFATGHLNVAKEVVSDAAGEERTVAAAAELAGHERVVELARMLSGRPDSASALRHASELLDEAAAVGAGSESIADPPPKPGYIGPAHPDS